MGVRPFCCGVRPPPAQPLYLATSTDRGKTFATKQLSRVSPDVGTPAVQWTPAGGSQGTVLAVYQDKVGQSQGSADIYVQPSTDGGATWGPEVPLNHDSPAVAHFAPLPTGASSTLKYLAAAFARLAAAGVIILALVAVRRRPKAMETMPPAGPQPVGAG